MVYTAERRPVRARREIILDMQISVPLISGRASGAHVLCVVCATDVYILNCTATDVFNG